MELERIVRGQGDVETSHQIVVKWGPGVLQEQGIVGQRRHCYSHLAQIVEILDDWGLPQQEAMRDGLTHHEGGHQMLDRPSLATMRPEVESVEATLHSQLVQGAEVHIGVVQIVGIGRILNKKKLTFQS